MNDASRAFDNVSIDLTLTFDNEEAARHFKFWLCGQGEQDYWQWMEYREQEEDGPITGLSFDYWNGSDIQVKCGRLSDDDNG